MAYEYGWELRSHSVSLRVAAPPRLRPAPPVSVAISRRSMTSGASCSTDSIGGAIELARESASEVLPAPSLVAPRGPSSPPHTADDAHGLPSARRPLALWVIAEAKSPAIAR